jgi:MFS family permease
MIKSFEELTEERIGFGRYQYIVISLLGLIFIADGIEMSAMSLIFPILKIEWSISENLQALIGSALFIGFFLGSLIAGIFTDKLGRKQTLQYASLLQFFLGIYSTFLSNPYVFLLVRGLFGFLLGYIVPIVPTLCAELIPMAKRGKITVIINGLFSVGQFLATVFAWMCLSSLSSGNWRAMLFICSLPPILVWWGSYKYLKESPCFVIMKGNFEEGIQLLNDIGRQNKGSDFREYTNKDLNYFREWKMNIDAMHDNLDTESEIKNNLKTMLSNKNSYRRITLSMWASWFGINFVLYGLVFILPFFLNEIDNSQHKNGGLESLLLTTFGEGLSGVIAYFLVDTQTFGRKYSLALGQSISCLSCLLACLVSLNHSILLVLFLSLGRLFAKMCFSIIYPLTAEIYPTKLRTMGVGIASAVGRIAGCIMPFVAIKLFYYNIYSPFISFFIVGLMGLTGTLMLPYDTRGRFLDIQTDTYRELSTQLKSDFRKI